MSLQGEFIKKDIRVAVAQQGARMHYAVPRQLELYGSLHHFYTDICASKGIAACLRKIQQRFLPAMLKRLAGRVAHGVPTNKITSFDLFGVRKTLYWSFRRKFVDFDAINNRLNEEWCGAVVKAWKPGATHVYAFNTAAKEIFEHARELGVRTILEQTIAPKQFERDILKEAAERYRDQGWQVSGEQVSEAYIQRERREWELADLILCGSEFVREAVVAAGGSAEKCVVVPYGVEFSSPITSKTFSAPGEKLRVLFAGAVGLRKGIPVLLEVARRCQGIAEFRVLGKNECPNSVAEELNRLCDVRGVVPRQEMADHYAWADVFLLPSFCEGSATVSYESAHFGVPVICTKNAGTLIEDSVHGYVANLFDADFVVYLINDLFQNKGKVFDLSGGIASLREQISESSYGQRLDTVFSRLRGVE